MALHWPGGSAQKCQHAQHARAARGWGGGCRSRFFQLLLLLIVVDAGQSSEMFCSRFIVILCCLTSLHNTPVLCYVGYVISIYPCTLLCHMGVETIAVGIVYTVLYSNRRSVVLGRITCSAGYVERRECVLGTRYTNAKCQISGRVSQSG